MLYQLNHGEKKTASPDRLSKDGVYFGLITPAELESFTKALGLKEDFAKLCRTTDPSRRNTMLTYEDCSFGLLDIVQADHILGRRDRIGFLILKNLFLIVDLQDEDGSTVKAAELVAHHAQIGSQPTLEKVVYEFLMELIRDDSAQLEKLESEIARLDDEVLEDKGKNCNRAISHLRRELLVLHGYYQHLSIIGETLCDNDNGLLGAEPLRRFAQFSKRVARLCDSVRMLREFAQQVRESYQAGMDYRLNNIMTIFTVITAVFLPLTLLTGWYGMNFTHMPELNQPWAYPLVILASLAIVGGSLWWFKKKKLF